MNNHIFATLSLEKNPQYVDELEKKYSIKLPPIFKAFVQTFEFGKFNPSLQHRIIHPDRGLGYEGFDNTLEEKIIIYFEQGSYFQTPKIFPIVTSGMYPGGICLGVGENNGDKIFLYKDYNEFSLIATDMLQFIKQLQEVHWNNL
jgi:hypothetical protein